MKVLEIFGDDYAAVMFDNEVAAGRVNPNELWNKKRGVHEDDGNEAWFEYAAYEFGEVDPKFIDFMREMLDYDDSKHHNFYILENK